MWAATRRVRPALLAAAVVLPLLAGCGAATTHSSTTAGPKGDCPAVRGDLRARQVARDDAGRAYEQARADGIAARTPVAIQQDLGDRVEPASRLETLRRAFLTARVTYDETFTTHPACHPEDEVQLAGTDRAAAVRYLGGTVAVSPTDARPR